jgi:hypothetical protein
MFGYSDYLGAFVAGLKAGFYYNTFPLMGETMVPENTFGSIHNGVFIQFLHRWFALLVMGFIFLVWLKHRKDNRAILWSVNVLMTGILIPGFARSVCLNLSYSFVIGYSASACSRRVVCSKHQDAFPSKTMQ